MAIADFDNRSILRETKNYKFIYIYIFFIYFYTFFNIYFFK